MLEPMKFAAAGSTKAPAEGTDCPKAPADRTDCPKDCCWMRLVWFDSAVTVLTVDPPGLAHSPARGGVWARAAAPLLTPSIVQPRLEAGRLEPGDSAHVTRRPLLRPPLLLPTLGTGLPSRSRDDEAACCRKESLVELTKPVLTLPKPWP